MGNFSVCSFLNEPFAFLPLFRLFPDRPFSPLFTYYYYYMILLQHKTQAFKGPDVISTPHLCRLNFCARHLTLILQWLAFELARHRS